MRERGFTLVELMVTLVVAGILVTISYPSLSRFFRDNQLGSDASQLQSMLVTARHHALNYQMPVIVCPLVNGACSNNWSGELSAFVDSDGNGSKGNDEEVLLTLEAVSYQRVYAQTSIRFGADGMLTTNAGTIRICEGDDSGLYNGVIVTKTGRSRVAEDDDHNGKRDDLNGNPISCT
ncbi:GspH/FimT family pseudopilin [Gallaecimonas pentaromativorans]|uniref:Type II secretion system protein H n=1 Tax=Gallaecimonas pentaromativorans TaxID=584787 RepID=A0A3N1P412_9GAMM|nr:GspH/FimT family pseudopilin [Gallaecimonas pentaromativorans]MED5523944.1 GspH/FimT family pseudopilin [Pseudomonadota bacterium]ROQ22368.1 type IV fimbrial biogenesis protein FimT [Gallaecimonas pentaromativorans]